MAKENDARSDDMRQIRNNDKGCIDCNYFSEFRLTSQHKALFSLCHENQQQTCRYRQESAPTALITRLRDYGILEKKTFSQIALRIQDTYHPVCDICVAPLQSRERHGGCGGRGGGRG